MKNYYLLIKVGLICIALFYQFNLSEGDILDYLNFENETIPISYLVIGTILYSLVLIIPYFPSLEIGLVMMIWFQEPGVIIIYSATVLSLTIAYLVGSKMKRNNFFNEMFNHLIKFKVTDQLSKKHPYLSLVFLLNMPGNTVLGGGGGIAMNFGHNSYLSFPKFFTGCAIATSPLPIIFLIGNFI